MVSIPQSGFGAFELVALFSYEDFIGEMFQSLSRDSGRLNFPDAICILLCMRFQSLSRDSGRLNVAVPRDQARKILVSIPQSGFGAFERF